MERLNYSTSAIEFLSEASKVVGVGMQEEFAYTIKWLKDAVKFMLPLGGRILDGTNYEKVNPLEFGRLPYKKIAIEFNIKQAAEKELAATQRISVPKRIALCEEFTLDEFVENFYTNLDINKGIPNLRELIQHKLECKSHLIVIYPLNFVATQRCQGKLLKEHWAPNLFFTAISDTTELLEQRDENGELYWSMTNILSLPFGRTGLDAVDEIEYSAEQAAIDSSDELNALFQLLTVINCKNIEMVESPAPEKLNKKRARTNKTPFYAYKTLVVRMNKKVCDTTKKVVNSERAKIREHLRSGHPRTLANGNRIWIPSTTVNAGVGKSLDKDYAFMY